MSIHSEADLILKLYELRREPTLREARKWLLTSFNPETMDDFNAAMSGEHNSYIRMVTSYWDMAAALVKHGAISLELFADTNGEYIGVFSKVELLLPEVRAAYGPNFVVNIEKLIDTVPNGRARTAAQRERVKKARARLATQNN